MSLEAGLVSLINTGIASACPNLVGGFASILPENQLSASMPYSWTYRMVGTAPLVTLDGQNALQNVNLLIDCHGYQTMANAIKVAEAIAGVLTNYHGTLTGGTVVLGVFADAFQMDYFNDASRSYVRTIRYSVSYYA